MFGIRFHIKEDKINNVIIIELILAFGEKRASLYENKKNIL